ncbi:MAG: PHB depolymerase family esterase [Bacteroidota bacterium]
MEIEGRKRTYSLHLPAGYGESEVHYPVVFVLHGNPSSGWQMQWYTGMSKTADDNGFIAVYPDAIDKMWQFDDGQRMEEEVHFVERLLEHLQSTYRVDATRVYFVGISGGSLFLSSLVKALPGKVAAISKIAAGRFAIEEGGDEAPQQAMPVLLMMGTDDYLFPGDVSREILSAEETLHYWLERNRCTTDPLVRHLPDSDPEDGSTVTTFAHKSDVGADVLFYRIEGGGHHWPNSRFDARTFYKKRDLGNLNKDFETNQVLWDFLSQYHR